MVVVWMVAQGGEEEAVSSANCSLRQAKSSVSEKIGKK